MKKKRLVLLIAGAVLILGISGGLFAGNPEVCNGVEDILKVDLYVPGCPPHPATLLEALIRFMGNKPR